MQIQIKRESLLAPITTIASVIERRQTLPILSYALMRLEDGILTITGTDLEIEIVATIKIGEGKTARGLAEFTVPARKLCDICRALPAETEIKLVKQDQKITVTAGRSRFSLLTLPVADFPAISSAPASQWLSIPQVRLKTLLESTHFCMAQQDVRYYLNGLYLDLKETQVRAVATDGHRMAIAELTLDESGSVARDVIVPRKGVQELLRLLLTTDEPAIVRFAPNHVYVEVPGMKFTSKLIDGKFPDYTRVIPSAQSKIVKLAREDFRQALGRAAILANEKYRGVRLGLKAGQLIIGSHNPEQEEATEELECDYRGETLEIGFNVNYLAEAAAAIDNTDIELVLNDANSSCIMRAPGDTVTQYIIMPMRL